MGSAKKVSGPSRAHPGDADAPRSWSAHPFGSLATWQRAISPRPMALRPRLAAGLPFRGRRGRFLAPLPGYYDPGGGCASNHRIEKLRDNSQIVKSRSPSFKDSFPSRKSRQVLAESGDQTGVGQGLSALTSLLPDEELASGWKRLSYAEEISVGLEKT